MPFSIEYCNAPMAVMTEITEKTPMVMPSIVSAERNLFAPSDDHAIFMISPNSISLTAEGAEFAELNHNLTSSTRPRPVNFHSGTNDRIRELFQILHSLCVLCVLCG